VDKFLKLTDLQQAVAFFTWPGKAKNGARQVLLSSLALKGQLKRWRLPCQFILAVFMIIPTLTIGTVAKSLQY
jgi:hypothetical protein